MGRMFFVPRFFGSVCRKHNMRANLFHIAVAAVEFKHKRQCVSFIHMVNVDLVFQSFEHPRTADSQYDFLRNAGLFIGVVKLVGNRTGEKIVFVRIGREQNNRSRTEYFGAE